VHAAPIESAPPSVSACESAVFSCPPSCVSSLRAPLAPAFIAPKRLELFSTRLSGGLADALDRFGEGLRLALQLLERREEARRQRGLAGPLRRGQPPPAPLAEPLHQAVELGGPSDDALELVEAEGSGIEIPNDCSHERPSGSDRLQRHTHYAAGLIAPIRIA
jgi:hypothetical protein